MILGQDILEFLGMDIRFSTQTVEWEHAIIPFKDTEFIRLESFYVDDPQLLQDTQEHLKKILDAKYEAADLSEVASGYP